MRRFLFAGFVGIILATGCIGSDKPRKWNSRGPAAPSVAPVTSSVAPVTSVCPCKAAKSKPKVSLRSWEMELLRQEEAEKEFFRQKFDPEGFQKSMEEAERRFQRWEFENKPV